MTSPAGGRAIHTSAASGASPPHGHDPAWTGWLPVPPGRRTPAGASRRVLLSYDGPRKCAWRSRLPWDNLPRGGGERRALFTGAGFLCFPSGQREYGSQIVLLSRKECAMAEATCREEYTYQVGKITFIVTPVYKDEGEPMRDILLKLMLADLESA